MPIAAWTPAAPAASLWAATARPAPDCPPLEGDVQTDAIVIGAGYTGLSAALHLAEAGIAPVVIEAEQPGWGASGRNGGVVSSKFRLSFPDIAARHGMAVAARMHALGHEAVDLVEELIATHGIADAAFVRKGRVKAAHSAAALAHALAEAEWQRRELGDGSATALSAAEVAEETGSGAFVGGVRETGSGGLHPLNYLRGLAEAAQRRRIPVHGATPALAIRREGAGVLVETLSGTVRARQAILATNGYSWRGPATDALRRRLVPFRSAIVATAPLSHNLAAAIMPTRRTCGETRRMMRWFRMVDDRVVFGGRGAFGKDDSPAAFRALEHAMVGIFPALADVPVAYRWSGLVAMTMDAVPHVGRLDDRILFAAGYNGAGVAMASLMGRYLARFAQGESPEMGLLDAARLGPVPFHSLREPAVRLVAGWYQFLDTIGR